MTLANAEHDRGYAAHRRRRIDEQLCVTTIDSQNGFAERLSDECLTRCTHDRSPVAVQSGLASGILDVNDYLIDNRRAGFFQFGS